MVVWTHAIRSPFEPHRRHSSFVAWHPGLLAGDLIPSGMDVDGLAVFVNGRRVDRSSPVHDGDHLTCWKEPKDPISATVGVLNIFGSSVVAYGALSGALYLASKFLAVSPEIGRGSQQSPTYSFQGITNARTEGSAVPIAYGRIRTGGMIVNEFITTTSSPPSTSYHALICLSEGPIQAIGDKGFENLTEPFQSDGGGAGALPTGIQINGNPAENLDGIEAWVRLGGVDQSVIPGYEETKTQFAAGFDLDQTEVGTNTTAAVLDAVNFHGTGALSLAQVDALWDTYGEAYSFVGDYDGFDTLFQFPAGLFQSSTSTGAISPKTVSLICRYIELDSGGLPITSGGPESDGYVRLPPLAVTEKQTAAFFSQPRRYYFRDPQLYAHAPPGEAATFDGNNDYARVTNAAIELPSTWTGLSNNIPAFSISGWFKYDEDRQGNRNIVELATMSGSNVEGGFRFGLQSKDFGFNPSVESHVVPVIELGLGTGTTPFTFFENWDDLSTPPSFQPGTGEWVHLAFTYANNYQGGGTDRFRLYANGVQVHQTKANSNVKGVQSASIKFLVAATIENETGTGANNKFKGSIDELRVTETELTAQQIADDYNDGVGKYGPVGGEVFGYHFDTDWTTYVTALYTGNDLTNLNGAAISASAAGVVSAAVENTKKAGRYKVEWMRASEDSTNASVRDDVTWHSITGVADTGYSHPGRALLALKIQASEQLNTTAPTVTALVSGRKVPIWDGASTTAPSAPEAFSRSSAWACLDYATNQFYGLGSIYSLADVDLTSLLAWASFSGGMIYDKLGQYNVTTDWTDMRYLFTAVEGSARRGEIEITFTAAAMAKIRSRYRPNGFAGTQVFTDGDYLGFDGVNVVTESVDTPEGNTLGETLPTRPGGWPITIISNTANVVTVSVLLPADPWTTNTLLSTAVGGAGNLTGTVEGRDARFEYNGVLDQPRSGWDGLLAIAAAGRATVIREGSRLRFKYETTRTPVDLLNWASIIDGSFEVDYAGKDQRPNALTVDFLDGNQNFERTSARVEDSSVQNASSFTGYRSQTQFLEGCTSRRQAMAAATFQLNIFKTLIRSGRFRTGPDSIPYDVGDVLLLSHEVTQWGTGGRVRTASADASTIKLEQDVTLAAATTYEISVRNLATGLYEVREIDTAVHVPPLTISAGTAISATVDFSGVPAVGDLYVFAAQGTGTQVQVTAWKRTQELEHEIEWVEYQDSVYTDDTFAEILSATASPTPAQSAQIIPTAVSTIGVAQATVRTPGGNTQRVTVSWEAGDDSESVSKFRVYLHRGEPPHTVFEQVASADASARSASFDVEGAEDGEHIIVAVQPVSESGARLRPERCARYAFRLKVRGITPQPPTGLSLVMDGDAVLYRWANGEASDAVSTDLRRGGWILGQPIASVPAGMEEYRSPSWGWASGRKDAKGDGGPVIVARHRSGAGGVSRALRLEDVSPNVSALETLDNFEREIEEWQDVAFDPSDIPNVVLTDLGVGTDYRNRKFLGFIGSSLTGSYETSQGGIALTNADIRTRDCFVEFFVEGEQRCPTTLGQWPALGSPDMQAWSLEGPTNPVGGVKCTLKVEIELDDSGTWLDYSPGVYRMKVCNFRISITRPDSTWTVRLYRVHQRVRRVPFRHVNDDGIQTAARARLYAR